MEFNLINEREKWNNYVLENNGSFLQCFEWGEFQEKNSKKVFRVAIKEEEKTLLQAQVIGNVVYFKQYFYIPYGPVFNKSNVPQKNTEAFGFFLEEIKNIDKKCIFLRIEPVLPLPEANIKSTSQRIQPQKTLILDLTKPEEEILKNMHHKTRYNISLAQKKGVKIKIIDDYSEVFYQLLKKTKERQGFDSYSKEYYQRMFDSVKVKLFLAEYQEKPIVASIVIFFGNRVTSLHTGFDYKYRELKAPYLLRWNIILEGKKQGFKEYDFWGIDEKKWPGVTQLKKSFGGQEIEYGPAKEAVFNKTWYLAYKILKNIL